MTCIDVTVKCPVFDSFRVQQVAGMFDVPLAEKVSERFLLEIPDLGGDGEGNGWQIGLIVGPSGSGKSTIAREMFGDRLYRQQPWPKDKAVIDGLGPLPVKQVTGLYNAVGFGSPPSWVKPYHVLSGGEKFRCDLARALAWGGIGQEEVGPENNVVAFDEFTSVVDRDVARVVSAAIARGIRNGRIGCRFVAVTCHYDVTEWLTPDWVVDMATSTFQRRCLQRPPVKLEIFRCRRSAWRLFARHHYLSGSLGKYSRCFIVLWNGNPVAFVASVSLIGRKNRWRMSRLVTLPDYQGIGIGMSALEAVADLHREEGHRVNATASHPMLISHCCRSPRWRAISVKRQGTPAAQRFIENYRDSTGRMVVSFEYLGGSATVQ